MAGNKELFQKAMTLGASAAWDLEWEKAISHYRVAVAEFPDDIQALNNLAAALYEIKQYDQALFIYQKVVQATPNDPVLLERVSLILEFQGLIEQSAELAARAGEIHLQNRAINKAVDNLTRSVVLVPENLQRRSRLALIFEKINRKDAAVREYLAAASLLQHSGQKDKAIELVNHCLKLIPNNNEASQALGLLRANQPLPRPRRQYIPKTRSTDEAQPEPPRVSPVAAGEEIDPIAKARKEALAVLAALLFDQEDTGTELEHAPIRSSIQSLTRGTGPLSQANLERANIVLHLSQAVDAQARGKIEEAANELEKAIDSGLDNAAAYFDLGLLRKDIGRLESAMRNLQHAVQHEIFALPARLLLGQTLKQLNRTHDASLQYMEALRLADASMFEGKQAQELAEMYEPIIETLFQADAGVDFARLCTTIQELLIQPDWRKRVLQARQQLPQPPTGAPPTPLAEIITQVQNTQVLTALSQIHELANQKMYRMAMEEAFWALKFAPTYLPLHTIMAEILLEQEQFQDAITKFNVVARAYSARGESARAIDVFRRITRLAPLDLTARKRLIDQLTAAGKHEDTIQEYIELGDVYYRLTEMDKARETYQKALNYSQQNNLSAQWTIEVLHHLADIDLQLLDWRRAIKLFQQIRAMDPADEKAGLNVIDLNLRVGNENQALSELGNYIAYLNRSGKTDVALEVLDTLSQNYPDHTAIRQSLAEQFQKLGKNDEAIEQWDLVGDLCLQKGNPRGAIHAIQQIISLNPDNVADYRQVLRDLQNS